MGKHADRLKDELAKLKSLKSVQSWGFPGTTVRVLIQIEKMALEQIPLNQVLQALQASNLNIHTDEKGDEYQIQVTGLKGKVADLAALENIYINTLTGTSIPLKQVADIQFESAVNQIRRYDQNRYVTVSAYVKKGFLVGDVYNEVIAKLHQHEFSEEFHYKAAGELKAGKKSFGGLGTIILITALGFFDHIVRYSFKYYRSLVCLVYCGLSLVFCGHCRLYRIDWYRSEEFDLAN
jgi:multidrug efflux pump subunit AcrB